MMMMKAEGPAELASLKPLGPLKREPFQQTTELAPLEPLEPHTGGIVLRKPRPRGRAPPERAAQRKQAIGGAKRLRHAKLEVQASAGGIEQHACRSGPSTIEAASRWPEHYREILPGEATAMLHAMWARGLHISTHFTGAGFF